MFKLFVFHGYEFLPECMLVHHMCSLPMEPEEVVRSPVTGHTSGCGSPWGSGYWTRVSRKSSKCNYCTDISPGSFKNFVLQMSMFIIIQAIHCFKVLMRYMKQVCMICKLTMFSFVFVGSLKSYWFCTFDN